jgi:DNA-binding HxlR family transcriptional regulator
MMNEFGSPMQAASVLAAATRSIRPGMLKPINTTEAAQFEVAQFASLADLLNRIGEKWSAPVVLTLYDRKKRFRLIQRSLPGVSQKMLTVTLRSLERDGFILRTVFPTIPPAVEYALTDLGRELAHHLFAIGEFARDSRARIEAARKQFDRAGGARPDAAAGLVVTG